MLCAPAMRTLIFAEPFRNSDLFVEELLSLRRFFPLALELYNIAYAAHLYSRSCPPRGGHGGLLVLT